MGEFSKKYPRKFKKFKHSTLYIWLLLIFAQNNLNYLTEANISVRAENSPNLNSGRKKLWRPPKIRN